jgi:hypothetical protein
MDSVPKIQRFALAFDPKDQNFRQRGCHLILQKWNENPTEIQFSMDDDGLILCVKIKLVMDASIALKNQIICWKNNK